MILTKDGLVKTILNMSKCMNAHKDFHTLHKKQLSAITKAMNIPDLITFDYENKKVVFKSAGFINDKNKTNLEIDRIVDYVNYYVNDSIKLYNLNYGVMTGGMCTNEYDQYVANKINLPIRNGIIRSHAEQIQKQSEFIISEMISLLYYNFAKRDITEKDIKQSIRLNIEAADYLSKEEYACLIESINEFDYI